MKLNKKKINRLISNFNLYRKPEIVAELVSFRNNKFVIKFSGSFVHSCCVNDYFDDFVIEASNKIKINKIYKNNNEYLVGFYF